MTTLGLGLIAAALVLLFFVLVALQNIHAQLSFMSEQFWLFIQRLTGEPPEDASTLTQVNETLERIAAALEERNSDEQRARARDNNSD